MMKETTIEKLAYIIKDAKGHNLPQPIFFLGAGASKTGNIPLANEIIKDILKKFNNNPDIQELKENEKSYSKLMDCLTPNQRNTLLKEYISKAKINVTHIYLAQLLNKGYGDYVLTVNFDNLMLRALALFNEYPPTYDMAILKDLTTTSFKKKSVVYLHGQHHGLWLLNSEEEMKIVKENVPRIFDSIKNERPWIFIGYSGDDPIFDHIKNLGRFDNGLYWVAYNEEKPNEKIQTFLKTPNTNAFIIRGYDSDSFMLKLNTELGLGQPKIVDKPFTALKGMLNNIVDIDDEEHFKLVKERLEISKRQVHEAIQQYEEGKSETKEKIEKTSEVDLLIKEIINLLIENKYPKDKIAQIESKAKQLNNRKINNKLAGLYSNWGVEIGNSAKTKMGKRVMYLYNQAFEKFIKALEIEPNSYEALYNYGTYLGNYAITRIHKKAENLYIQAFEKLGKAIAIKPDFHNAYHNLGIYLSELAKMKKGKEADGLYKQAFEKFSKALEIKPNKHHSLYMWGTHLGNLAKTKKGKEAEDLYNQAFDKFKKVIEIKPDMYVVFEKWGTYLGNLAKIKEGKESEDLYNQAFYKFKKAIRIKSDLYTTLNNWGVYLGNFARTSKKGESEGLYNQAFDKFRSAIEIKPDMNEAYCNWGIYLGSLARTKKGKIAHDLFNRAFDKFKKAIEIKSDMYTAFVEFGNNLGAFAKIKDSEDLYRQSFDKYKKAFKINPDRYEALLFWGSELANLAKTKEGMESVKLYSQAIEKYKKVIEIKPDNHEALRNWGTAIGYLAKFKEGKEVEELFKEAIEKQQESIEKGGDSYNLACIYAIKSDKKNALFYLNKSLGLDEIKVAFVREDDDWKDFLQNDGFIKILKKYEK